MDITGVESSASEVANNATIIYHGANRGLCHAFASTSNCSQRTQLGKRVADECISTISQIKSTLEVFANIDHPSETKHLSRRQQRMSKAEYSAGSEVSTSSIKKISRSVKDIKSNKDRKMEQLENAIGKPGFTKTELDSSSIFFCTGVEDPIFDELIINVDNLKVVSLFDEMNIIDNVNGSKFMELDGIVPVYILAPRNHIIPHHSPSSHEDVRCLNGILWKHNKTCSRGSKHNGISTRYATLGAHCSRNKPGIEYTKIHKCCAADYLHLKKMLKRVESFARMYLPFGILSTLHEMKLRCGDQTSIVQTAQQSKEESVWASIATSFNYVSPAHIDKDAFLSCLMVSYYPKDNETNKYKYKVKMEVALYFCIPEYRIAVALRPGDVLFFNPLHYHCISQRTSHYIAETVYVTSFYMKTGQIGGNDNNWNITNIEMM